VMLLYHPRWSLLENTMMTDVPEIQTTLSLTTLMHFV